MGDSYSREQDCSHDSGKGDKVTRREHIEQLVGRINELSGRDPVVWKRIGKRNVASVGSYTVDHAYGGYRLEEIVNESGGVDCPFGHGRYSYGQFVDHLRTILTGMKIGRERSVTHESTAQGG